MARHAMTVGHRSIKLEVSRHCKPPDGPGRALVGVQGEGAKLPKLRQYCVLLYLKNAEKRLSYVTPVPFYLFFPTPTFTHPSLSKANPIFPLRNKAVPILPLSQPVRKLIFFPMILSLILSLSLISLRSYQSI